MWVNGEHCKTIPKNFNDSLLEIRGELDDKQAKITFAQFLSHNPTIAAKLLLGEHLYPIQSVMVKAMFMRDFFLAICSRGLGKSYLGAIFIILYAIFNPGIKIGICSKTFRQARMVFKTIEDLSRKREGIYFKQCVGKVSHDTDAWTMEIGRSMVIALPLGDGGKIRGYRFNVMVIDEMLLLTSEVINEVIRPFLAVQIQPRLRSKLKNAEDKLIAAGEITEEDRYEFPRAKLLGLSSASYKFEYLYELYDEYLHKISNKKDPKTGKEYEDVSHCIFQLSYEVGLKCLEGLYDVRQLNESRAAMSDAQFKREFGAEFTDESAGYYSMRKMLDVTIKPQSSPSVKIVGDPKKEYVLAIDPNYNDSEKSDHFAMAVGELDPDTRSSTLVHGYALSKSNIKNRAKYLHYLLNHFNIVYVIVDAAGGIKFINDCNEFPVFKDSKLEMKFFDQDFENEDYLAGVRNSLQDYNLASKKICHAQTFNPKWIRSSNETLQTNIDRKKIWFASYPPSEGDFNAQVSARIPINDLVFDEDDEAMGAKDASRKSLLLDQLGYLIDLTKTECAMIEVNASPTGHQTFDLPRNLKKIEGPDKPRKDSYTVLLLMNWGAKCYFDMKNTPKETIVSTFLPRGFK